MNYLIVCPKFVSSESDLFTFSHGVAYVSASLKKVRDTVFTLNLNYKENVYEALKETILENKIDCIAVGGTSRTYNQIKEILTYVRDIYPNIITIVGGGLISAAPVVSMQGLKEADIGIIGEGEHTICEIADALESGSDLANIDGIVFRNKENEIITTKNREDIEDIDALPFPDYEGFDYDKQLLKSSVAMICTSRSCPYNCTFCFHTCGKKYRRRNLDNVFEEIDLLVQKYNVKSLGIIDELFVSNKKRILDFCKRIKKYNITWSAQARVDGVNEEILKAMREAGCLAISYGIESASNEILKGMKKNTTIEQIEHAFEITRNAYIKPSGNFLYGDINETCETFNQTLKWYSEHPQFDCSFNRIIILPGSDLYTYAIENGFIKDEIKYWIEDFPFFNMTKMNDEDYNNNLMRLLEAKNNRVWLPKEYNLINLDMNNRTAKIEVHCDVCGERFQVETADFTWQDQQSSLCPKCNQSYNIPLYLVLKEKIDSSLKDYLSTNKIFIYGVGLITRRLFNMCEVMQNDNVILIDSSEDVQKYGLNGKKVYSQKILEDLKASTVIIGTIDFNHFTNISKMINANYSNVDKIQKLYDFLFEIMGRES